jgi:hypothetical protein
MRKLLLAGLALAVLFSSCEEIFAKRIKGNGNIITQSRSVSGFSSVDVSGSIDIYASMDSSTSVRVEADENLQEYIQIENEGGVLRVHSKNGFNLRPSSQIKVYVASSNFNRFEASGSCDIYGQNKISSNSPIDFDLSGSCDATMDVNSPKISADLSGACKVNLKGQTKNLTVKGSGSTTIKCFDLLSENANIDISGAGDAEVYASVKLDIGVSGAGDVRYKGNANVNQHISGAGSVKKVD